MIDGKRVLGVVPARGGSKGIPRKNLQLVSGKSLLGWTIEVAQQSTLIDYLMVSTEDLEIAEEAKRYGCEVPFSRAAELATDTADAISVPLDAAMRCRGYDLLVLLAPTSPLRISEDIDGAIQKCVCSNAPACVSVCLYPVKTSYPPVTFSFRHLVLWEVLIQAVVIGYFLSS